MEVRVWSGHHRHRRRASPLSLEGSWVYNRPLRHLSPIWLCTSDFGLSILEYLYSEEISFEYSGLISREFTVGYEAGGNGGQEKQTRFAIYCPLSLTVLGLNCPQFYSWTAESAKLAPFNSSRLSICHLLHDSILKSQFVPERRRFLLQSSQTLLFGIICSASLRARNWAMIWKNAAEAKSEKDLHLRGTVSFFAGDL